MSSPAVVWPSVRVRGSRAHVNLFVFTRVLASFPAHRCGGPTDNFRRCAGARARVTPAPRGEPPAHARTLPPRCPCPGVRSRPSRCLLLMGLAAVVCARPRRSDTGRAAGRVTPPAACECAGPTPGGIIVHPDAGGEWTRGGGKQAGGASDSSVHFRAGLGRPMARRRTSCHCGGGRECYLLTPHPPSFLTAVAPHPPPLLQPTRAVRYDTPQRPQRPGPFSRRDAGVTGTLLLLWRRPMVSVAFMLPVSASTLPACLRKCSTQIASSPTRMAPLPRFHAGPGSGRLGGLIRPFPWPRKSFAYSVRVITSPPAPRLQPRVPQIHRRSYRASTKVHLGHFIPKTLTARVRSSRSCSGHLPAAPNCGRRRILAHRALHVSPQLGTPSRRRRVCVLCAPSPRAAAARPARSPPLARAGRGRGRATPGLQPPSGPLRSHAGRFLDRPGTPKPPLPRARFLRRAR